MVTRDNGITWCGTGACPTRSVCANHSDEAVRVRFRQRRRTRSNMVAAVESRPLENIVISTTTPMNPTGAVCSTFPPGLGHGPTILPTLDNTIIPLIHTARSSSGCSARPRRARCANRPPFAARACCGAAAQAPRRTGCGAQHYARSRQPAPLRRPAGVLRCERCPLLPDGSPQSHEERCEAACVCYVCGSDRHLEHACFIAHGIPRRAKMVASQMSEVLRLHLLHLEGSFNWLTTPTSLRWVGVARSRGRFNKFQLYRRLKYSCK